MTESDVVTESWGRRFRMGVRVTLISFGFCSVLFYTTR